MNFIDQFQVEKAWNELVKQLETDFGVRLSLEGVLLFIGLREAGLGFTDLSKEDKEELIDMATCVVLSASGYFVQKGVNPQGLPVFERNTDVPIPKLSVKEQETLLKQHIVNYFEEI